MKSLIEFLSKLDEAKISYNLLRTRDFSITVMVYVPGERWEIDFLFENEGDTFSGVWVEKFITEGKILGEEAISELFERFSD